MWVNNRSGPYVCVPPRLCWLEMPLDPLESDLSKSRHFVVRTRQICTALNVYVSSRRIVVTVDNLTLPLPLYTSVHGCSVEDELHSTRTRRTRLERWVLGLDGAHSAWMAGTRLGRRALGLDGGHSAWTAGTRLGRRALGLDGGHLAWTAGTRLGRRALGVDGAHSTWTARTRLGRRALGAHSAWMARTQLEPSFKHTKNKTLIPVSFCASPPHHKSSLPSCVGCLVQLGHRMWLQVGPKTRSTHPPASI